MAHQELFIFICTGIAVCVARVRHIVLTRLHCRTCYRPHLHCECKPPWVRALL